MKYGRMKKIYFLLVMFIVASSITSCANPSPAIINRDGIDAPAQTIPTEKNTSATSAIPSNTATFTPTDSPTPTATYTASPTPTLTPTITPTLTPTPVVLSKFIPELDGESYLATYPLTEPSLVVWETGGHNYYEIFNPYDNVRNTYALNFIAGNTALGIVDPTDTKEYYGSTYVKFTELYVVLHEEMQGYDKYVLINKLTDYPTDTSDQNACTLAGTINMLSIINGTTGYSGSTRATGHGNTKVVDVSLFTIPLTKEFEISDRIIKAVRGYYITPQGGTRSIWVAYEIDGESFIGNNLGVGFQYKTQPDPEAFFSQPNWIVIAPVMVFQNNGLIWNTESILAGTKSLLYPGFAITQELTDAVVDMVDFLKNDYDPDGTRYSEMLEGKQADESVILFPTNKTILFNGENYWYNPLDFREKFQAIPIECNPGVPED